MTPNEKACEKCLHYRACLMNSEYVPTKCSVFEDEEGYCKLEWISVDERLPEDDGFVLMCTSKGSIVKGHYEHKWKRWSGLNNRLNVTHWMPLPEAPKMKGGAE